MLFRNSMLFLGLVLATLVIVTGCESDDNKVPIFTRTSSSADCGVVPMDVQFVAIASGGDLMADPTGANSYLDISWDFGDGSSGNGSVTPHTYTVPGDYDVVVTVTDDDGDKSTKTMPIIVRSDSLIITTIADTTIAAGLDYFTAPTPRASNVGNATYEGPTGEGMLINEVLVFNETVIDDGSGSFGSYMELVNTSLDTLDMNNFSLTTDPYIPDMHVFSNVPELLPGEFQMVWIDGRDLQVDEPHTLFQLTGNYSGAAEDWPGETLYLLDSDGSVVDVIVLRDQQTDVSYGRSLDGLDSAQLQLNVWNEACDFETEGSDYSRFRFMWELNNSLETVYTGRSPLHTFSTLDIGTNVIDLQVFDEDASVYRTAQVTVEVIAP